MCLSLELAEHKYFRKSNYPLKLKVADECPLSPPATMPWFIEQEQLAAFAFPCDLARNKY